tara:strand:+ start:18658 stop:20244 length:1587 start_codon:yes stop_codon:yes gene_type:complete
MAKDQGYEALSYVWGNPMSDRFIYCPKGKIAIAPNLGEALVHVRRTDRTRVLWVDAICIDQANVQERSHQVSIMGSIYAKAQHVLVWLGPDPRKVAMSTFDALRSLVQPPYLNVSDELVRPHMEEIAKSEWFTRLWVVQELFMAKRAIAVWGYAQINFIYLHAPWSKWLLDPKFQGPRWCARKAWGFQTAIRFTGALHCSDPLDRIYALLALSRNDPVTFRDKIGQLVPDYTKSPSQLFFEVACIFVESGNTQQLLSHVNHERTASANLKLPSWVPNWGEWTQHEPLLALDMGRGAAVGLENDGAIIDHEQCILKLVGIAVDQVTHSTAHDLLLPDIPSGIKNIVAFWAEHVEAPKASTNLDNAIGGSSKQISFLQSLLYVKSIDASLDDVELLASELFAPLGPIADIMPVLSTTPQAKEMLKSLAVSVRDHCRSRGDLNTEESSGRNHWRHRKLFITSNGHIGLGPSALRRGDKLAIISGLKSSVIIRKTEVYYTFVGTSYAPSISNGEVIQDYHSGNGKIETFELH